MKKEQDYIQDITHIRSMMERSSKFLTLSGWAGIMAGIYALIGVSIAHYVFHFDPNAITTSSSELSGVIIIAISILLLALCTAIYLSYKKAESKGEQIWNSTSRRLLSTMAFPLLTGGVLMLIFLSNGLFAYLAPFSLLFYGLSLYNASLMTIKEVKIFAVFQIALGLFSSFFNEYGLISWALGFGVGHIIYGLTIYIKYEK